MRYEDMESWEDNNGEDCTPLNGLTSRGLSMDRDDRHEIIIKSYISRLRSLINETLESDRDGWGLKTYHARIYSAAIYSRELAWIESLLNEMEESK